MARAPEPLESIRHRLDTLVRARLQAPLSSWHEAEYVRLGRLEAELLSQARSNRGALSRAAS